MVRVREVALFLMTARLVLGGVVLDGSFGVSGPLPGPNYMISASLGRQVGNNLFHSFNQFSLVNTESAIFTGPSNIQNIVSRVTGGMPSSIDGKISSQIQGANFFLLNPAGVMFGPNAKVDVSGSFVATTADYIADEMDRRFSAAQSPNDILTSAPLTAYGFLGSTPRAITVSKTELFVRGPHNFGLIGGDITLDTGALLSITDGTIFLASAGSAGKISLDIRDRNSTPDVTGVPTLGTLTLGGGSDSMSSLQAGLSNISGGRIAVRANRFVGSNASLLVYAKDGSRGDGIDIEVADNINWGQESLMSVFASDGTEQAAVMRLSAPTLLVANAMISLSSESAGGRAGYGQIDVGQLTLLGGGQITSSTDGAAAGCDLIISANGAALVNSAIFLTTASDGKGGSLQLNVSNLLTLGGFSKIASDVNGSGNGGDVAIKAGSITLLGAINLPSGETPSGIVSAVNSGAVGHGGSIIVQVDQTLRLSQGTTIQSNTQAAGDGGQLSVSAATISLSGSQSSIASTVAPGASGRGGDLTVTASGNITVTDRALIVAETKGVGNGGGLFIQAADVSLAGASAIGANTLAPVDGGNAGDLNVEVAGTLQVLSGSQISDSTSGSGAGGQMHLAAGKLVVSGTQSGISAEAMGTGNGGEVQIDVGGSAEISDGAEISLAVTGKGDGGSLTIHSSGLTVAGINTGITAQTSGTGNAGDLRFDVTGALQVSGGANLTVGTTDAGHGGNIDIHAASVEVAGINAMSPSQIAAQTRSTGEAGDITMEVTGVLELKTNGRISASTLGTGDSGHINIRAEDLFASGDGTGIAAQTLSPTSGGRGGDIRIGLTGQLSITDHATIVAGTKSPQAPAGNVNITAHDVDLSGNAGIASESLTANAGDAGSVVIVASGTINLGSGAGISALTVGDGNAGAVNIKANELSIDGNAAIFSSTTGGAGNAGNIAVSVSDNLRLTGGGQIQGGTFSAGRGGDLTIHAGSLSVDGGALSDRTGIFAESNGHGDAGDLDITVDHAMNVVAGGAVSTTTFLDGKGGNLNIHAGSLLIDSGAADFSTLISARSDGTGDAGNMIIDIHGTLQILGGGLISTTTASTGKGGDLDVQAGSFLMDGTTFLGSTGIFTSTFFGSGNAGDLTIRTPGVLRIIGGADIAASTYGPGQGGSVTVNAGSILISDFNPFDTGVFAVSLGSGDAGKLEIAAAQSIHLQGGGQIAADTLGSGNGGTVTVRCESLLIDGAMSGISSTADVGSGKAGDVDIHARNVRITNRGLIGADAFGNGGGNIRIAASDLVYLRDSAISATAGNGAGGNITIDPVFIILSNSIISANAAAGQGGNINLISDFFLNSGSLISASGTTNNGTINITAPDLDLGSDLITLPASLVDAQNRLQERCTALLQGDFSSFISIGRGGTEEEPEDLQTEF